uniref:Uncharacterized protein n=1 Tax=Arundo donax TaxID=35708 RepID=A0A0A9DXX1_ARUDO
MKHMLPKVMRMLLIPSSMSAIIPDRNPNCLMLLLIGSTRTLSFLYPGKKSSTIWPFVVFHAAKTTITCIVLT